MESRNRNTKRKKAIADTFAWLLDQYVTDPEQLKVIKKSGMPVPKKPKYKDFLAASLMGRTIKRGTMKDILDLMEILGEADKGKGADEDAVTVIIDV